DLYVTGVQTCALPIYDLRNWEAFTARGKKLSYAQLAMAIMRNYDASRAPEGFPISQIVNLFKPSSTNSNSDRNDRMTSAGQDDRSEERRVGKECRTQ